ncbi:phosphatase PAP2 family protein [Leptolyngbya sp. FACHB-36]|uniref:phosphatase PAP2 family protein n=1 Tax=Leptolyngbya sp. FACHB-36 TaxID=2692808 RepID=UPI001681BF47|nr:phosphatase PAP2 family protein [Leptolyngbya sp. FACHB-36]MBD2022051.1 phosphatase PAP2 family protein [Leptolyngbya sp. FACHB-36]
MFRVEFRQYLQTVLNRIEPLLVSRWRSLLGVLLGVALPLLVFQLLAVEVWRTQAGLPWDVAVLMAVHSQSRPDLDHVAVILTGLGTRWGVFPASVGIGLVLLGRRRWRSLLYWSVTLLGCGWINRLAKTLIHRVRPALWQSPQPELDFAFPSGHAMSSMTFVVALVIVLTGNRWQRLVGVLGGLFVVAIGWTRLYLGVHFPSDVLAGWMVALAWAIGVSLLIRPTQAGPKTLLEPTTEVSDQTSNT